jgi:4-oxalocrotonate tautomerase family enzyme
MPLINIKVLKGTVPAEKKAEMIKRVSEIVAEIEAGPEAKDKLVPYTWCLVEEVDFEGWGIGGNPVTPEVLQQVISG